MQIVSKKFRRKLHMIVLMRLESNQLRGKGNVSLKICCGD